LLKRKSRGDRMRAKLKEIKTELRLRMHQPIPVQGKWLGHVVTGYFHYHAVPTNIEHSTRSATTSRTYGGARSGGAVKRTGPAGSGSRSWPMTSSPDRESCTPGLNCALPSPTQGGTRVPELGPLGSVRGVLSNEYPYRDPPVNDRTRSKEVTGSHQQTNRWANTLKIACA
jgi:hypothetical protein